MSALLALGGGIEIHPPNSVRPLGDVNADGIADFSYGFNIVFGGEHIATITSEEQFSLHGYTLEGFSCGSTSFAGDVNGDGLDDLLHVSLPQGAIIYGKTDSAPVHLSDVEAGIGGFPVLGAVRFPYTRSAGDLNGDGFDDLVLGTKDTMMVIAGRASREALDLATASPLLELPPTSHIAFGDFDADGILDLAYSDVEGPELVQEVQIVSAPDGWDEAQRVTTPTGVGYQGSSNLQAGDFDLNGVDDLIADGYLGSAPGPNHGISLLYGPFALDGEGPLTVDGYDSYFDSSSHQTLADLNGDGIPELIVSFGGPDYTMTAKITSTADWPSPECSGAWSPLFDSLLVPLQALNLGDIDADGRDDLFVYTVSEAIQMIVLDACD